MVTMWKPFLPLKITFMLHSIINRNLIVQFWWNPINGMPTLSKLWESKPFKHKVSSETFNSLSLLLKELEMNGNSRFLLKKKGFNLDLYGRNQNKVELHHCNGDMWKSKSFFRMNNQSLHYQFPSTKHVRGIPCFLNTHRISLGTKLQSRQFSLSFLSDPIPQKVKKKIIDKFRFEFLRFCMALLFIFVTIAIDSFFLALQDRRRNVKQSAHSDDMKWACEDYTVHFRNFLLFCGIGCSWSLSSLMAITQVLGTIFSSQKLLKRLISSDLEDLNDDPNNGNHGQDSSNLDIHPAMKVAVSIPALFVAAFFHRTAGVIIILCAVATTIPKIIMV